MLRIILKTVVLALTLIFVIAGVAVLVMRAGVRVPEGVLIGALLGSAGAAAGYFDRARRKKLGDR